MLSSQPPWYVAGALLGSCVVLMYLVANARLGVVSGFSDVVERVSARSGRIGAPGAFLIGVVLGGTLFAVANGGRFLEGYGWVTREFSAPTAVAILVGAGALLGDGAKVAGGCTAGNGLCGNAIGSPSAAVSTVTFFTTAVVVSLATAAIFGSSL